MFQFDVYVLFFDITVTNYCIKDVLYEPDVLHSLSVWKNFEHVNVKVEKVDFKTKCKVFAHKKGLFRVFL